MIIKGENYLKNEERIRNFEKDVANGKIPDDLVEFYNTNMPVLISRDGVPKELSSKGLGFMAERCVSEEDIQSLSKETLAMIFIFFRKPDFILKNFSGGSIKQYA